MTEMKSTSAVSPDTADSPDDSTIRDLRLPGALVRTALSSEQTLMSWIRTALSLFTFGFSITQFFFFLDQSAGGMGLAGGPRRLGIALILMGIMSLAFATLEHIRRILGMKKEGLPDNFKYMLPIGSAMSILAVGIAAFVTVLMKWHL